MEHSKDHTPHITPLISAEGKINPNTLQYSTQRDFSNISLRKSSKRLIHNAAKTTEKNRASYFHIALFLLSILLFSSEKLYLIITLFRYKRFTYQSKMNYNHNLALIITVKPR